MPAKKFIVASSVARLIRRELPTSWLVEGYLNGGDNRSTHVTIEGDAGRLVLAEEINGKWTVEETEVPRRQAEALLEACVGRLDIDRTVMTVSGRPALLDRITSRGNSLDLFTVFLDERSEARVFSTPQWLGREITDATFTNRALAVDGIPEWTERHVTNDGLEALLDLLERRGRVATPLALHAVSELEPARELPREAGEASEVVEQIPPALSHREIISRPKRVG